MKSDEIKHAFRGKLIGSPAMKHFVCETVAKLPDDVQRYITTYCWFLSSLRDAWAFTFTGNDLADQHLIFLSDDLLKQDSGQIRWSITHEIGHVVLKHRNSVMIRQSKAEITQQEIEADEFAAHYI